MPASSKLSGFCSPMFGVVVVLELSEVSGSVVLELSEASGCVVLELSEASGCVVLEFSEVSGCELVLPPQPERPTTRVAIAKSKITGFEIFLNWSTLPLIGLTYCREKLVAFARIRDRVLLKDSW